MENIETQLREEGITWDLVQKAFIWHDLSKDFLRQLVETDQCFKTQLQHHLLYAFHGYASYPSNFYKNMWQYLKLGLAEQKELAYYTERVGMLYMNQLQQEQQARVVHSFIDDTGKVLDQLVW